MKRIARNKHKTGQRINTKKLLKYKKELEDCVESQQKTIEELQSEIANNALAYQIKDKRYNDMLTYCELNRPEILQLMKTFAKQGVLAAQGKVAPIEIKLMKAKRKAPKIPESPPDVHVVHMDTPTGLIKVKMKLEGGTAPLPSTEDVQHQTALKAANLLQRSQEKLVQASETQVQNIDTAREAAQKIVEIWNPKTRKFEKGDKQ